MPISERIEQADLALYEVLKNPVLCTEFIYGLDLLETEEKFEYTDYQKEFLCDFNPYVSLCCARSVGKSLALVGVIFWLMVNNVFPLEYVVYTVPSKVHLEPIWSKITRYFKSNSFLKCFMDNRTGLNNSDFSVKTLNNAQLLCRIAGMTGGGANVNGLHTPFVLLDEMGFYPFGTWIELQPIVNTFTNGFRLMAAGVPTGLRERNVGYHCDQENSSYTKHNISAFDNPRFTDADKIRAIEQYGGEDSDDYIHMVCFTPETKVYTNTGLKEIKNINVGDIVLTHRGNWKEVTKVFIRKYSGKLLSIKTQGNYKTIKCTPNHPIYSMKTKKVCWSGNKQYALWKGNYANGGKKKGRAIDLIPTFIPANELEPLDRVSFPVFSFNNKLPEYIDFSKYGIVKDSFVYHKTSARNNKFRLTGKFPEKIKLDEKILKFLGLFIAKGCNTRHSQCQLVFNSKEKHLHFLCEDVIKNYFGLHYKTTKSKGNSTTILFSSQIFSSFIDENIGHLAEHKKIPVFLLGVNSKDLLPLLEGLFAGDGSIRIRNGKPYASYTSISKLLVEQISYILSGFNIITTRYKTKGGKTVTIYNNKKPSITKDVYNIELSSKAIHSIYTNHVDIWDTFDTNDLAIPIKSIDEEVHSGLVYNLEVEDDNSYVVENFSVHNCGRHGKPVFALFDRNQMEISNYPVYKMVLDGSVYYDNLVEYVEKLKIFPGLPDKGTECLFGIDLGYTEPTAINILYVDKQDRLKFHGRIRLNKVNYFIQEKIIDFLDSKFKPFIIGIDEGSAGKAVIPRLQEHEEFIHKDYKKRLLPINFSSQIVLGMDSDGKEIKSKTKPFSVSVLQDYSNNHRIVYSSTDLELVTELERMTYSKTTSGEIMYKTLTERGGKSGEDHFTAALLCAAMAYYLTKDNLDFQPKRVKLARPHWFLGV